jgi:hypothetical protein
VSLPWSRSVHLKIAPHRISAVLERGWPASTRIAAATQASAERVPARSSATAEVEGDQIEAVLQQLELSASVRGARYRAEIADALVHFDVAEGLFATQTDRELQTIAAACVEELLGEEAPAYEVRWNLQTRGRHLFIAALPRAYLTRLAAIATQRGSRLVSVQPAFCRQWNAFAHLLTARVAIFAVTSGAHVVVACVLDGALCGISVGPWTSDPIDDLAMPEPAGPGPGMPIQTSLLIERRATRLFASLGVELESDPQFILVTPEPSALSVSPPWTLVRASGILQ